MSDCARDPIPEPVRRRIEQLRQERLTGTYELNVKDGRVLSHRFTPPRERIQDQEDRIELREDVQP